MKIRVRYRSWAPIQSPFGRMISGFVLVFGLLICLYGAFRCWAYSQVEDELVSVDAVIDRIDIQGRGDNREHRVYVSYTYQGTAYEDIPLSWYSSDMYEGAHIPLNIHPNAPSEPVDNDGLVALLCGGFLSLIAGIFSIISWWNDLKSKFSNKEERLC